MTRRAALRFGVGVALACLASPTTRADGPPPLPDYPDHSDLMVVRGADAGEVPVRSPADWWVRRAHVLGHFQRVAGPLPGAERRVPLDVRELDRVDDEGATRIRLTFASEPGDRVTAWLTLPADAPTGRRRPAMLCLHQTTPIGKDEPVGLGGKANLRYARELATRGYVTLAPDYPVFGERRVDAYALGYESTTMKAIWDHLRAVDLLASRPEVDPDRIGVIGHSLGGHNAIFAALFDDRLRAVVSSCGFNSFRRYYEGDLTGWSHAGYMPAIRERYGRDPALVPFDFPELIGALAPRPFFTNSPRGDANFEVTGVEDCIRAAAPVYHLLGRPDHLEAIYPEADHDFPPAAREAAYRFLDRHLKAPPDAD